MIMIKETIIIFVIIFVSFSLISLLYAIKDKIKTDNDVEVFFRVLSIIEYCVISTNQIYVDELKKLGKFDKESQKIAFEKTKNNILSILKSSFNNINENTDGTISSINGLLIDDTFINTKIEESVRKYKNK